MSYVTENEVLRKEFHYQNRNDDNNGLIIQQNY